MAPLRVGLAGFGRIGRNLFRILYKSEDIQIAAISDIADHGALEYLIRFDTIFGPFPEELSIKEGNLYVVGRQVPMLSEEEPGDVPWGDLGVDVVIEATAQNRTREDFEKHLEQGAKRVILCVPQKTPPDITVVMGVNDDQLKAEHKIVSNGSCTAHCAAPVIKILNEAFGIQRAFLNTVHAYTNQQRLADVPSEDKRRGRAAANRRAISRDVGTSTPSRGSRYTAESSIASAAVESSMRPRAMPPAATRTSSIRNIIDNVLCMIRNAFDGRQEFVRCGAVWPALRTARGRPGQRVL